MPVRADAKSRPTLIWGAAPAAHRRGYLIYRLGADCRRERMRRAAERRPAAAVRATARSSGHNAIADCAQPDEGTCAALQQISDAT